MTDTPAPRKRLLIRTWGCQMNVYDSARMADVLAPLGYAPTEQVEEADMVILNTCHIREKAADKAYSDVGRLRREDGTSRWSRLPAALPRPRDRKQSRDPA